MQGQRILSLLVENCGRVHQGNDLDNQHKGDEKRLCSYFQFLVLNKSISSFHLLSLSIHVFAGLVGDVLLNNSPLQNFTIYSLDMKPSFIDRFVFN